MSTERREPGTDIAMACPSPPLGYAPPLLAPAHRWYALAVRSNRAFRVRDALLDLKVPAFLPTYWESKRWSDRIKRCERQLFPGYLFACFDSDEDSEILSLSGVLDILPNALRPVPVDDSEIESLRIALTSGLIARPCPHVVGESVLVERGPLTGASGVVQRVKDEFRLVVGIKMLGRAIGVTLDAEDVKKL